MKTLSYKIQIDASPEAVWDIIADFGGVYRYSPGVKQSHTLSSQNQGVGADRICHLAPAGNIQERILEWNEGKDYTLEIYQGKGAPPFKTAQATLSVEPAPNGGTIATGTLRYKMKYGPIGALMDAVMFGPFLQKGFSGLLAGLKHYAETGEEVAGPKGLQFVAVPA
ncbi:MAG: SRPBCC family protein [Chloroflexota bacterium]